MILCSIQDLWMTDKPYLPFVPAYSVYECFVCSVGCILVTRIYIFFYSTVGSVLFDPDWCLSDFASKLIIMSLISSAVFGKTKQDSCSFQISNKCL